MAKHKGSHTSYAAGESTGSKPKKKVLARIEIAPAENGGHIVTHHFQSDHMMGGYHEPEQHAFGKGEGHMAMSHMADAMGIKMRDKAEEASEETKGTEESKEQEDAEEYSGGDDQA